jgi:hypothetical protein
MRTCGVVLKVLMFAKDDESLLTFKFRAWNVNIYLELLKMQFDMIPRFVCRRKAVESDFVRFSWIPEAEETLLFCAGLRKWGTFGDPFLC